MITPTSIGILAGLLSREYGIEVVCKGDQAFTTTYMDGKIKRRQINIPVVETDSEDYYTQIRGYVDHEVAHVRFTDDDSVAVDKLDTLTHDMWNILEDTYVETRMGEDFIGCRKNLRALSLLIFRDSASVRIGFDERPMKQIPEPSRPGILAARILNYVLMTHRAQYLPELTDAPLYKVSRELLTKEYPALSQAIDAELPRAAPGVTRSTAFNVRMAERLRALVQDKTLDKALPDPTTGELGDLPNETQNAIDSLRSQMDQEQKIGRDSTFKNSVNSHGYAGSDEHRSDALISYASSAEHCATPALSGVNILDKQDRRAYIAALTPRMINEAMAATQGIRTKLFDMFQAFTLNRLDPGRHTGRIRAKSLCRTVAGNYDIYSRRVEHKQLNTEVVILADMSGSMSGEKAIVMSEALFAIAHSLYGVPGVTLGIYGFSSSDFVSILDIGEKPFDRFNIKASGGTILGNMALQCLSKFGEMAQVHSAKGVTPRRVFIIISDGDTIDEDMFRLVLSKAKQAEIETVGIGLGYRGEMVSLSKSFDKDSYIQVEKVQSLPTELLRVLGKRMGLEKTVA